jgi:uncharacterized FlaG/YvyC family protein
MSPVGATSAISYAEPVQHRPLIQAVKAVNAAQALGSDRELTYAIDRKTRRVIVRIVNSSTGEILDQIPNEQVQQLADELK